MLMQTKTDIYNTAKQALQHHIDWPPPLTIYKCNLTSCHVVLSLMADSGLMGCDCGGLVLCSRSVHGLDFGFFGPGLRLRPAGSGFKLS